MSESLLTVFGYQHNVGDPDCNVGCCNNRVGWMPGNIPCKCTCGGIVHGGWEPSSLKSDDGPTYQFKCDTCGVEYTSNDLRKLEHL